MFIRQYNCVENGKGQAYWALVESYRTARGPRQRIVAWLGKLDEADRLAGTRTLDFFDRHADYVLVRRQRLNDFEQELRSSDELNIA